VPRPRIKDEFTDLPISRQRKFQLRMDRDERCVVCGEPAVMRSRCLKHLVEERERQRRNRGWKGRYSNTRSYRLEAQAKSAAGRKGGEKSNQPDPAEPLNQLQIEIIDFFVRLAPLLGQPRSVVEIYGLLFSSIRPLDLDEVIKKLRISRGSACTGLNQLLRLGAAKRSYVAHRRSTNYEAVEDLGSIIARLLRERIPPDLGGSLTWLKEVARTAKRVPAGEQNLVNSRIRVLQNWQRKFRHLLRLVEEILTTGNSPNA
jgi:DNA-binding transcriptional regulator GbsR (MarR family)